MISRISSRVHGSGEADLRAARLQAGRGGRRAGRSARATRRRRRRSDPSARSPCRGSGSAPRRSGRTRPRSRRSRRRRRIGRVAVRVIDVHAATCRRSRTDARCARDPGRKPSSSGGLKGIGLSGRRQEPGVLEVVEALGGHRAEQPRRPAARRGGPPRRPAAGWSAPTDSSTVRRRGDADRACRSPLPATPASANASAAASASGTPFITDAIVRSPPDARLRPAQRAARRPRARP